MNCSVTTKDLQVKMKTNTHESVKMLRLKREPRKHHYSTGRYGNIWYRPYECPICGVVETRLANLNLDMFCDGSRQTAKRKRVEQS